MRVEKFPPDDEEEDRAIVELLRLIDAGHVLVLKNYKTAEEFDSFTSLGFSSSVCLQAERVKEAACAFVCMIPFFLCWFHFLVLVLCETFGRQYSININAFPATFCSCELSGNLKFPRSVLCQIF